jgi:hypothetical protein
VGRDLRPSAKDIQSDGQRDAIRGNGPMKNVKAVITGTYVVVRWINKDGHRIRMPMYHGATEEGWVPVGCYFKAGLSKSNPHFEIMYALPFNYKPGARVMRALEAIL